MKKSLALLLCTMMLLSFVACGGPGGNSELNHKQNVQQNSSNSNTDNNQNNSESSEQSGIEIDKNLFDVQLTIPADFLDEGATQESLDAGITGNDGIKSVVLNADGSATYTMTKAAHKELLESIQTQIDASLDEMISNDDYAFTAIEHNNDYTKFTVKTEAEELSLTDSFSVLAFYMYGGMYSAFSGTTVDNIHVDFVNATTGDIIDTANSSDIGE